MDDWWAMGREVLGDPSVVWGWHGERRTAFMVSDRTIPGYGYTGVHNKAQKIPEYMEEGIAKLTIAIWRSGKMVPTRGPLSVL